MRCVLAKKNGGGKEEIERESERERERCHPSHFSPHKKEAIAEGGEDVLVEAAAAT